MLLELVFAMTLLAVAVGALMAMYGSSLLSLRRAGIEGNALTLADRQIEKFKTLPYSSIAIDTGTIPASSDPYVASPPSNLTSEQRAVLGSGQAGGGTVPATETVTGPDGRAYRVDTYVFFSTPAAGQPGKQLTVAVRSVEAGAVGPIRAQAATAFDPASTQATTSP